MEAIAGVASKLDAKVASYVRDHRLPGVAAGIVSREALAWSAGVGFSDLANQLPPDSRTLYRVASITKTFTGTAIMRLRDEGKLDLDDAIGRHIPEVAHLEKVTIRRLLSHESGLQSEPPDTDWRRARYETSIERNLSRAKDITTRVPPNTQQKYSNIGYQLLGEVVARASGMPYAEFVRTRFLGPLGMRSTDFDPLPDALAARCATGYAGRFVSDELAPATIPPGIGAEGGLWSCVDDLARWLVYHLQEDATLREMHRPRYLADEGWTEAFGLAWYGIRRAERIWIMHSGALHGFRSNVSFDPSSKVGAIVLINGLGDAATLAMDLADIARDAVAATAPGAHASHVMPATYGPLLGVYFDPELGLTRRVEWRDGKLTLVDPDLAVWRPALTPTGDPDVFLIEPGYRESGEHCVFQRLADGRVASVFIAAGTWTRMEPMIAPERIVSR